MDKGCKEDSPVILYLLGLLTVTTKFLDE